MVGGDGVSDDQGASPYFQPDSGDPEPCNHRTCTASPTGTVMDEHGQPVGRYCNKHGHERVGKLRAAIVKAARAAR